MSEFNWLFEHFWSSVIQFDDNFNEFLDQLVIVICNPVMKG